MPLSAYLRRQLQSINDSLLLPVQSFAHRGLLDLHRQVLTYDLDHLLVRWLESHSLIGFLVDSRFELDDHHHVIIFEQDRLGDLRNSLDRVSDLVLVLVDGKSDLLCLREA